MDTLRIGEVVAVSRFLTPDHIDVTHVPMTYARPRGAWIDRYAELRARAPIDAFDRMARRRNHSNSVVNPEEIHDSAVVVNVSQSVPRVPASNFFGSIRIAATSMFKRRAHA